MVKALRQVARDIVEGFWTGLDVLLWGWPFPRRIDWREDKPGKG